MFASIAALGLACGVTPDPRIADEFFARLETPPVGWAPVPCSDREQRIESTRRMVHFAQDLRGYLREFDTPLPEQLQERLDRSDLLGPVDDLRCVMNDFQRLDRRIDPDALDVLGHLSNLYVLKARTLFARGEDRAAWDHVLGALRLYGHPVAPTMTKQLTLLPVLEALHGMLREHPVPPPTLRALVEAVDATLVPTPVRCAALRHELLEIAVGAFRVHFGQREREAVARRFGLHEAMRAWQQHRAGKHGHPLWDAWRDAYDAQVPRCEQQPFAHTVQAAAPAQSLLDLLHPPTGVDVRVASDRLNRAGPLVDAQVTMLAVLRVMALRDALGRDPTTTELALDFGRRPRNPWDGRYFTIGIAEGSITVTRGTYVRTLTIPEA
ncbi:MAG: hypothetical protein H6712_22710 [Myxococcales bacterium]|nr:hypothetical protein [Myxococcales bacterium]